MSARCRVRAAAFRRLYGETTGARAGYSASNATRGIGVTWNPIRSSSRNLIGTGSVNFPCSLLLDGQQVNAVYFRQMNLTSELSWQTRDGYREAIVGDFKGGDGLRLSLVHYPTNHRRGPWKLLIEICGGPHHHDWGCFDEDDHPVRYYHHYLNALSEAKSIVEVLVRDRLRKEMMKEAGK